MPTYTHVLLATDLIPPVTHPVYKKIKKLAELYQAKLSMIHVVEHLAAITYSYVGSIGLEEQLVKEATEKMEQLGKEMGVAKKDQYIEVGYPKTEIVGLSKRINVDLIIVGSHGHRGITALIGSTTNAILHSADCDVLTIRTADKEKGSP